jgi:hypothetical protein
MYNEPGPGQPAPGPLRREHQPTDANEEAMIATHILTHGAIYFAGAIGYLFLLMIGTSPRIWGYADYSEAIKRKVPPQTKTEKTIALIVALPWLAFTFGFPIYSVFALKANLGGEIAFWTAFLDVSVLVLLVNVGDVVILDWLIVSKITPAFVIIPGTQKSDYKDFSHHFRGHVKATLIQLILCCILAAIAAFS